jgi:hypothetical protein
MSQYSANYTSDPEKRCDKGRKISIGLDLKIILGN